MWVMRQMAWCLLHPCGRFQPGIEYGSLTRMLSENESDLAGSIAEVVAYDRGLSNGVLIWRATCYKWGSLRSCLSILTKTPSLHSGMTRLPFRPISDKQVGQSATLNGVRLGADHLC